MCVACTTGTLVRDWWDRLSGARTVLLNAAVAAVLLLTELVSWLAGFGGWGAIFDVKTAMLITIGVNVLNIVLRFVTTTPVFQKPSPTPTPPPSEGA